MAKVTYSLRADATDAKWERVVFAEMIIPNVLNVFNDLHTPESVKEFAYGFAKAGIGSAIGIDIDHDNVDRSDSIKVVEYFIARAGDPDFIEGAWVVAMWIGDDAIWQRILDGDINGFSYEAMTSMLEVEVEVETEREVEGTTEPAIDDGHVHDWWVTVDENGRVIEGGTTFVDGHNHDIVVHSYTEMTDDHNHRYNILKVDE